MPHNFWNLQSFFSTGTSSKDGLLRSRVSHGEIADGHLSVDQTTAHGQGSR
jgi:hypothetical protein